MGLCVLKSHDPKHNGVLLFQCERDLTTAIFDQPRTKNLNAGCI